MILLVIGTCIYGMYQHAFMAGFKSADNLLSLLFTMLLFFFLALILLLDHGSWLDLDLRLSLKLLNLKLT
jgi:hypothetical protein